MRRCHQKVICICCVFFLLASSVSCAYGVQGAIYSNYGAFNDIGRYIAGFVYTVGMVVCIGQLMIKGIKYMLSSVQGKADLKKELIPWFIGLVLLLTMHIILEFFKNQGILINIS